MSKQKIKSKPKATQPKKPELENEAANYATRVNGHLQRMGFKW